MYQVAVHNHCTLPKAALYCLRYHSFYPWHHYASYTHLTNAEDAEMLKWVSVFQTFDLYSKSEILPDIAALKPYCICVSFGVNLYFR